MRRAVGAVLCGVQGSGLRWRAAVRGVSASPGGDDPVKPQNEEDPLRPTFAHADDHFASVPPERRDKRTFHASIAVFQQGTRLVRGHVEFINSALKNLEAFNLHKDLDTYKALLNVFPKGALIPRNRFQKMFVHYPLQQFCCVRLLDQMEWFGVQPDKEVYDLVINAFGEWTLPAKKIKRMLYWMPKLRHTNNYLDRRTIEGRNMSAAELAYIALKMMSRDPGSVISFVNIRGMDSSVKEQWVVSAQSPLQKQMIERIPEKSTLYIDGPYRVYVSDRTVQYVQLTADPNPSKFFDNFQPEDENEDDFETWRSAQEEQKGAPNMHEQKDETILALAVLGDARREWAAAWANHLAEQNPSLLRVRFLFRITEMVNEVYVPTGADTQSSNRRFV